MEKDLEYYESLDKRSKEYKEWKKSFEAAQEAKPEGLGDVVANITKATGLDKVAEAAAEAFGFDDCGCEERQERWNKKFSFRKPECFTEDEYLFLKDFFETYTNMVAYTDRRRLYEIYNRVFRRNESVSSCSSCLRSKISALRNLLSDYK